MNQRNKEILVNKLRHHRDDEFVGYLTVVEVLYLSKFVIYDVYIQFCRDSMVAGDIYSMWFYFYLPQGVGSLNELNEILLK